VTNQVSSCLNLLGNVSSAFCAMAFNTAGCDIIALTDVVVSFVMGVSGISGGFIL